MHTKILATIGPACSEKKMIQQLTDRGVRIFRLNFSHGSAEDFIDIINRIREVEKESNVSLTILQDLSGPKIRAGDLKESPMSINVGDEIHMGPSDAAAEYLNYIPFDHPRLLSDLNTGDIVRVSDGGLKFEVTGRKNDMISLVAADAGIISSRKGISFPGIRTSISALTDKDRKDLAEGLDLGIDAVALSFVQGPEDIAEAKDIIEEKGKWIPVVAKLEREIALKRLDEIIDICDVVMVARGDLGLECPLPSLPTLQKRIISACNEAAKPVIVATQMLLSMVHNPMPTRAETTDVANAVLDGADCLMLSEETAIGNYPVESVSYMREISSEAEKLFFEKKISPVEPARTGGESFLAYAACLMADKVKAKALVAHTDSGFTARLISSCRPRQNIYGLSPNCNMQKYMNFSWGVTSVDIPEEPHDHLQRTENFAESFSDFASGDRIVITAGHPKTGQERSLTNLLKIYRK
ncbi:pyruvate kinase [Desulfonatronovibrio magnus]|uniref:pyruvate kinase n=1 Tax=Desulfonatronovibrio magnus TaxID=698827 RepID=UPI0005EBEBF7|nr:pyruvate kinase [Desulfonatronovibrio magnus]RQD67959.1 MAG: pyruvate kinase [Desulfonatronovibrio sp. MSAO_Bac4]